MLKYLQTPIYVSTADMVFSCKQNIYMKYSLKLANGRAFKNPPPPLFLVLYELPLYKISVLDKQTSIILETVKTFLSQEMYDAHHSTINYFYR